MSYSNRLRDRSLGRQDLAVSYRYQTFPPYPGAPVDQTTFVGYAKVAEHRDIMNDRVVHDFHKRRAEGEVFNHPMGITYVNLAYELFAGVMARADAPWVDLEKWTYNASYFAWLDSIQGTWANTMSLGVNLPMDLDRDLYLKSVAISARNKVNPVLVQSLVSIAEAHKTIDMIANAGRTLANFYRGIRRGFTEDSLRRILGGDFSKAKAPKGVDIATRRWLEYRYGWTPLIYEVQGALKALSVKPRRLPRETVHSTIPVERKKQYVKTYSISANHGTMTMTYETEEYLKTRAYVLFEADLQFQSARDFGVAEFPLATWELVPYSFVVDWFVNIGNWLEAITPKLGVNILAEGATCAHYRKVVRTCTSWPTPNKTGVKYSNSGFVGRKDSYVTFDRFRSPGLGQFLTLPPIDVRLNVKRVLDALALMKSARASSTLHRI